ncbi:hypothetical protein C0993_006255, partial [Termitomyces sp. T159_Od127]
TLRNLKYKIIPALFTNPNEAIRPGFALEDYTAVRNALMNENINEEAAVALLESSWTVNNMAEREIWVCQRRGKRDAERERTQQDQEEREQRAEARQMEEEVARREERKKHKTKYMEISMVPPPVTPLEILPTYATT